MIDQKTLKYFLRYDPETGEFRWNISRPGVIKNSLAGSVHSTGYREISIHEKKYRAGRLAFFYMTGRWPDPQIDHINRIRDDDRWSNLREVTSSENNQNKNSRGCCPYTGVHINKGRFRAQIETAGKKIHLGYYDNPEQAAQAYREAAKQIQEVSKNDRQ